MDYPEAYTERTRIARKPHKCCECKGTILFREPYRYVSGVWDGRGDSFKFCQECWELRRKISKDYGAFDGALPLGEMICEIIEAEDLESLAELIKIKDFRGAIVPSRYRKMCRKYSI